MIWNIVDNRKSPYRWAKITAVIEPTYHDNSCTDSDQAPETMDNKIIDEFPEISVSDLISHAHTLPYPVTLFLYDLGHGISVQEDNASEHFSVVSNRFRAK